MIPSTRCPRTPPLAPALQSGRRGASRDRRDRIQVAHPPWVPGSALNRARFLFTVRTTARRRQSIGAWQQKAGESSRSQGSLDIESTETKPASSPPWTQSVLWQAVAVAALLMLARVAIPVADGPASTAMAMLIYATSALFAALACRAAPFGEAIGAVRWAVRVALVFVLIVWLDPGVDAGLQQLLRGAVVVFLTTCFCLVLFERAPFAVAAPLLAFIVAIPVWAAPALEYFGNPVAITNLLIAVSPLTVIAVALDFDYLRAEWFYANSALGSMRYAYPTLGTFCAVLFLGPAITVVAERFSLQRISVNSKSREAQT